MCEHAHRLHFDESNGTNLGWVTASVTFNIPGSFETYLPQFVGCIAVGQGGHGYATYVESNLYNPNFRCEPVVSATSH